MSDHTVGRGVFRRHLHRLRDYGLRLDGRPLSDWGLMLVSPPVVEPVEWRTSRVEVPGRAGGVDMSLLDAMGRPVPADRECTLTVAVFGDTSECIESRCALMRLDGMDVTLGWRDWPGIGHGTLAVGRWEEQRDRLGRLAWASVDLTVRLDPYLTGEPSTFEATVSGVDVLVHTDAPVRPTITTTPPAGTRRLYLTIGSAQLVYDFDPAASGSRTLLVDCGMGSALWGGTPILPSLDSDYPTLVDGVNHAEISAGSMRVDYTPLALI